MQDTAYTKTTIIDAPFRFAMNQNIEHLAGRNFTS